MGSHASPQPERDRTPWRLALARRFRRRAVLTGAAAAAFAVVAAFTYVSMTYALRTLGSSGASRDQAVGCAPGGCGSMRAASAVPNFTVRARSSAGASRHHRPSPRPTPSADLAPIARAPANSQVSIGFSASKKWHGGFEGQLTIVNHSSEIINTWRITITLPKDHVTSVWDAVEQIDGDALTLRPTSWDPPISAGGSLSMYFVARGPTTSPTSCTYNGSPCG